MNGKILFVIAAVLITFGIAAVSTNTEHLFGLQFFNLEQAQATHAPQEQQSQTNLQQFQQYQHPLTKLSFKYPVSWKASTEGYNTWIDGPNGFNIFIALHIPYVSNLYPSVQSPLPDIARNYIQSGTIQGKFISSKQSATLFGPMITNTYIHTQTGTPVIQNLVKMKSGILLTFNFGGTQSQIQQYNPIVSQIFQSIRIDPNFEAEMVSNFNIIEQMKRDTQDIITDTRNIPGDYMADLADSMRKDTERLQEEIIEDERCEDPRSLGC